MPQKRQANGWKENYKFPNYRDFLIYNSSNECLKISSFRLLISFFSTNLTLSGFEFIINSFFLRSRHTGHIREENQFFPSSPDIVSFVHMEKIKLDSESVRPPEGLHISPPSKFEDTQQHIISSSDRASWIHHQCCGGSTSRVHENQRITHWLIRWLRYEEKK